MFKNYVLIAFRNLRKNKIYSLINLSGLAIGMAACLVIYLFISAELSFDQFHTKKAQIFRLDEVQTFDGTNSQKVALSMPGMAPNMKHEFPEIKSYTRFWGRGKMLYKTGEQQVMVNKTVIVDSTFLEIFDFDLIAGNRATALDQPNNIVITEKIAKTLFNSLDVIGENLVVFNNGEANNLKITGVADNVPDNSHLQFDILLSMSTITTENPEFNNRFGSNNLVTYLLLNEDTDVAHLESKFPDFMVSHINEDINQYYKLYLQPLTDVHLGSVDMDHDYHNWREFDRSYVTVFTIMAAFVLLIAAVNFMNLSTARSASRSKEVGLRKSIGAKRSQIVIQFLGESMLLSFVALFIALTLTALFIPFLNDLTGRSLAIGQLYTDPIYISAVIGFTLLIGILAGVYPAFVISSFSPVNVLKGKLSLKGRKPMLQNLLVIGQFVIAITLIISTILAVRQLNYMKNKDIGFNIDQIVLVPLDFNSNKRYETLKTELKRQTGVLGVTASGQRIGNNFHQWGFRFKSDTAVLNMSVSNVNVDFDYFEVYDIKIKEGRAFSRAYASDPEFGFIINEELVKQLGLTSAIGRNVGHGSYHEDSLGTIVGVTENFNFNSLHHQVNTLAISLHPGWGYDEMSIKIEAGNITETINKIEATWKKTVPEQPFEYSFLDQHFDTLYASEDQMSKVVPIIAILAIIIACLGLYGLSTITIEQRIKEIGIRKVLGASATELFVLLSKNFTLLVVLAFIISGPITYLFMKEWLANFAFHIDVDILVFIVGGLLTLLIAVGTVSYKTIAASNMNPTETLKYE